MNPLFKDYLVSLAFFLGKHPTCRPVFKRLTLYFMLVVVNASVVVETRNFSANTTASDSCGTGSVILWYIVCHEVAHVCVPINTFRLIRIRFTRSSFSCGTGSVILWYIVCHEVAHDCVPINTFRLIRIRFTRSRSTTCSIYPEK